MADVLGTETYDDIINFLSGNQVMTTQELVNWINDIEYQGFDPKVTLSALLATARKLGLKKGEFCANMEAIIAFYVSGGTNYNRASQKWKPGAENRVKTAMTRFNILPNLPEGKSGPEVITVGRIAILFNEVVAAMFELGFSNPVISSSTVPLWASFPGAASLISDVEWNQWGEDYIQLMADFSMIVTKGKDKGGKTLSRDAMVNQQRQFASVARSSGFAKETLLSKRKSYGKLIVKYTDVAAALGRQAPKVTTLK